MNLEIAVQIATIFTLLLTAAALLFAYWSFRKQTACQVYLAYTERFEQIMASFPDGALASRLRLGTTSPERSEELSVCILRYLNLCSEEFYLYKTGFLSKRIWAIWQPEIERTLCWWVFKREWPFIRSEFVSYPAFLAFVERVQANGPSSLARTVARCTPAAIGCEPRQSDSQ